MIKSVDLEKFRGQYPYGSELFGVYQTLLGWRGARARSWFMTGYARDRKILRDSISNKMLAVTDARPNQDGVLERVGRIDIGHRPGISWRQSRRSEFLEEQTHR